MPDRVSTSTSRSASRRSFFKRMGAGAAATALLLSGCDSEDSLGPSNDDDSDAVVLDFANDFGVLNYAFALEQLEYAFYDQVLQGEYYAGANDEERQILRDLRDHELSHVDFLATAIPALGGSPIGSLTPNFDSIDFSSRSSVLATAKALEDTGVSAYNGAGQYLTNPDLLTIAGKIVSVEARHAAAIRSIFDTDPRSFAGDDVVDPDTGLDVVRTPAQVLGAAGVFVTNEITLRNVPS